MVYVALYNVASLNLVNISIRMAGLTFLFKTLLLSFYKVRDTLKKNNEELVSSN